MADADWVGAVFRAQVGLENARSEAAHEANVLAGLLSQGAESSDEFVSHAERLDDFVRDVARWEAVHDAAVRLAG